MPPQTNQGGHREAQDPEHDGRFPTLLDVVNYYNDCKSLSLSDQEKSDLVQYLMSLPKDQRSTTDAAQR